MLELAILQEAWESFYNLIVTNASDATKTSIVSILILITFLTFAYAIRTTSKNQVMNSWFCFWLSIGLIIFLILYLSWI